MCTVTLSYDKNNATARQQLESLLSTGLFYVRKTPLHSDEVYEGTPSFEAFKIAMGKNLSLDELEHLVVEDIRAICNERKAV